MKRKSRSRRAWTRARRKRRREYRKYLKSPQWAAKRQERLDLCKGVCEACNAAPATQVHHVTYERIYAELVGDLRGLCRPCHEKEHPDKVRRRKSRFFRGKSWPAGKKKKESRKKY